MRGLWKLAWIEAKLFLREPMAAFFTLVFPLMMLFLFGSIFGNEREDRFGGFGYVDVSVPAYTAMIIANTGLVALSIAIASYREMGILRRLRATPLRPQAVLTAQLLVLFTMTVLGMLLLIAAAVAVYDLRFAGNVLSVIGAFVLGTMSFFALGFVLAALAPTARTAQVIAMMIFFPMLFLSGAAMPSEILPENVRTFAQVLPLTHVVTTLRGTWVGESLGAHLPAIAVLGGMLVIGVAVSARTFRWE